MSQLEELIRQTLLAREQDAPAGANLVQHVHIRLARRRRRQSVIAGASAAAVVALAITSAILLPKSHTETVGSPANMAVPVGMQPVSYHGIEMFVPAAWTPNDENCGTPLHDTVLIGDGYDADCLQPQPPGLTVVRLMSVDSLLGKQSARIATTPATIDGKPARKGTGTPAHSATPIAVLAVPSLGVVVSVESPASATTQSLLASAHIVSVDAFGCRSEVQTLLASDKSPRPGAAQSLVPPTPTNATICRYANEWLARSVLVSPQQLGKLVSILNTLPAGISQPGPGFAEDPQDCNADTRRGFIIQLGYANQPGVKVFVHIGGCHDLSASNGSRTTKINNELATFLVGLAGYDAGFPDPNTLR